MLKITVSTTEQYDEVKEEFVASKEYTLQLEHSLVSLSKWESRWCKPFLANDLRTWDETIDYIRCMTITQNVDPEVYNHISEENVRQVNAYIDAPMTATTFGKGEKKPASRDVITAEVIYHRMISWNIPVEFQKWHLNRLITLITVCNLESKPPKKMSKRELMARNRALNAARRNSLGTTG